MLSLRSAGVGGQSWAKHASRPTFWHDGYPRAGKRGIQRVYPHRRRSVENRKRGLRSGRAIAHALQQIGAAMPPQANALPELALSRIR